MLKGLLTGKYNDGIPENTRYADQSDPLYYGLYKKYFVDRKEQTLKNLNKLKGLADELGCSMAQLAMAWCINNPDVTTAVTGASSPKQLQ